MAEYPRIQVSSDTAAGDLYVTASTPHGAVDITQVRGAATTLGQVSFTDPFGPAAAQLLLPSVSLLDAPGEGDLWWLRPGTDIDIVWTLGKDAPGGVLRREMRWEGYIAGEQVSLQDGGAGSLELVCKGALRMAQNTVLMAEYPMRPWPYEHAIGHAIQRCREANGNRFGGLQIEWPGWWDTVYSRQEGGQWYLEPLQVRDGDLWSGLVTRQTGEGEDALAYITDLLSSMQVESGEFTIELDPGRRPVLRFRDTGTSRHTAVIDAASPGFAFNGGIDYEARADVVYGQGRSMTGLSYSNMQMGTDGRVFYVPFAHNPRSWPPRATGVDDRLRRDVRLSFFEGLSPAEAARTARLYRRRFASASFTGTITLGADPYVLSSDGGELLVPRFTLRAGDRLRVTHFRGLDAGVLFYVTEASHDIESGVTTLSVDTAVRDYMTSDEVRQRGRDALESKFSLATGRFSLTVRDKLLPWNEDSGYMPLPAKALFDTTSELLGSSVSGYSFPWEEVTQQRPPSDPEWRDCYVGIPPASSDVASNWNNKGVISARPLLQLSQAGSAQLLQVMAVWEDGSVARVPFHFSIYMNTTVTAASMPKLNNRGWEPPLFPGVTEGPYPFFPGAFEQVNESGTRPVNYQFNVVAEGTGPVASFGGPRAPGGYWPQTPPSDMWDPAAAAPTGLLSAESPFDWDIAGFQTGFSPDREDNSFASAGQFGVMIYCESMWDDDASALVVRDRPVFFVARVFRKPPGTS